MAKRKRPYTRYQDKYIKQICKPEIMSRILPENFDLLDDFLDYTKATNKAASTIRAYRNSIEIFLCWNQKHNNNKYFLKIKKGDFQRFLTFATNELCWSPNRKKSVLAALSVFSKYCLDYVDEAEEMGFENFACAVKRPKGERVTEKDIFSKRELQHLLDKLVENNQLEIACCLSLAMNSGRSPSELIQFKTEWFDKKNLRADGKLLLIPEPILLRGGKEKKQIYICMPEFQPYLDKWLEKRKNISGRSPYLFPGRVRSVMVNRSVTTNTLSTWRGVIAQYNTKKTFNWEVVREFFKSELKKKKMPTELIIEMTGWCPMYAQKENKRYSKDTLLEEYFENDPSDGE